MSERQRYIKEFKLEALRLLEQSDKPAADVARELGVRRNQLYKWKQQLSNKGTDQAFQGPGRNAAKDQQTEVIRMKQRITELEEENTILKKAAVYFAKELP